MFDTNIYRHNTDLKNVECEPTLIIIDKHDFCGNLSHSYVLLCKSYLYIYNIFVNALWRLFGEFLSLCAKGKQTGNIMCIKETYTKRILPETDEINESYDLIGN